MLMLVGSCSARIADEKVTRLITVTVPVKQKRVKDQSIRRRRGGGRARRRPTIPKTVGMKDLTMGNL